MQAETVGKSVRKASRKTPAQRYAEWFDEQVKLGIEDIEAGRVISHEEVAKRSEAHLVKLKKKYD